jgi:hypothetical protein
MEIIWVATPATHTSKLALRNPCCRLGFEKNHSSSFGLNSYGFMKMKNDISLPGLCVFQYIIISLKHYWRM